MRISHGTSWSQHIISCRFIDMNLAGRLRLLGDPVRLRLLRALAVDRFNVTELTAILGLAQSGVSRHLGLLRDAGLVVEARDGGFTYYRLPAEAHAADRAPLWGLLGHHFETSRDEDTKGDEARLQEVLRLRKENFEAHGTEERQLVPGRSWAAWARALGCLLPPVTVADLGCGEGYLAIETARWARRVIAIDRSPAVLARAQALAKRRQVTNIVWRRGELERVPLGDETVEISLLSQALHHADDPSIVAREAVRITRPGGHVLVLDLRSHGEAWVRERLGDRRLGFSERELTTILKAAGLQRVKVSVGARRAGGPFTVLVANGQKPGTHVWRRSQHAPGKDRRI
jgi:ArsR family transcriptional regulator